MDLLAILLVSAGAAAVQATVGFGYSLVFAPIAALLVAPSDAIGASIIAGTVGSLFYYAEHRPRTPLRSIAPMVITAILATPAGLWLLVVADEATLRILIGIAVLATALVNLAQRGEPEARPDRASWQMAVGAASGVMRGAVSLSGPPVILYQHWVGGGAAGIRSRMFAFFFWTGIPAVLMGLGGNVFSADTWWYAAAASVGILPGIALGRNMRPRIGEHAFSRLSMGLLAATSALAVLGAIQSSLG